MAVDADGAPLRRSTKASSGALSVASLRLKIGVAIEGDGSRMSGHAFRVELPLRQDDAIKMAVAVASPCRPGARALEYN
jgi:hypothetical protein